VSCVYEAGLRVNSQVDRVVRIGVASKGSDESSAFSCCSSSTSFAWWVWVWLIFCSSLDFTGDAPVKACGIPGARFGLNRGLHHALRIALNQLRAAR